MICQDVRSILARVGEAAAQQPESDDPLRVVPFADDARPEGLAVPRFYEEEKRFNVRLSARSRDILRVIAEDARARGVADPVEPPGVSELIELALGYVAGRTVDWKRVVRDIEVDKADALKAKPRNRRRKVR